MSAELVSELRKYCPTRPDANWARVPKDLLEVAIRALATQANAAASPLTAALAQEAGQQSVGYFLEVCPGRIEQAAEEFKDDPDVFPLYRSPPTLASAIERTLEAAAKVCEQMRAYIPMDHPDFDTRIAGPADYAAAIRALSPAQVLAATQSTTED